MKKGLIMVGVAFLIATVMIASANYLVVSKQSMEKSDVYKMKIDAVLNRHNDVKWIINKSVEEARSEATTCTEFAVEISDYLSTAFSQQHLENEWSVGSAQIESEAHSITENCPEVTVEVNYTVTSKEMDISKSTVFTETYTY